MIASATPFVGHSQYSSAPGAVTQVCIQVDFGRVSVKVRAVMSFTTMLPDRVWGLKSPTAGPWVILVTRIRWGSLLDGSICHRESPIWTSSARSISGLSYTESTRTSRGDSQNLVALQNTADVHLRKW